MEQLGQEGSEAYLSCDYVTALDKWQRFLALAKEAGDRPNEARTLNNIGMVHVQLGQYGQALEHHRLCLWTAATRSGPRRSSPGYKAPATIPLVKPTLRARDTGSH